MDRTRASSLESHHNLSDRYELYSPSISGSKIERRNRLHSVADKHPEFCDENRHKEYFYKRKLPMVTNSELKSQFDVLQCTVNRMLNGGAFEEMSSGMPQVNLSEALKHEYRQMMSALKELESILGCKRRSSDVNFSAAPHNNDPEIHQLQREIYYRDSLIKCLSDRLKVLCKANDKLIIDYEHQENILSEELLCLKHQLEKAKDALRALSTMKSRSNMSMIQDIENESYYLKESLRTKEMIINDLKHRLDKMSRENIDLKCELENKHTNSRYGTNQIDRELSYTNHFNNQLQAEIESLKQKIECKNQLINELQNKLDIPMINVPEQSCSIINKLQDELFIANEENELTKEAIIEQSDMLDDLRNQVKILSENNQFKDETICDLRCCLRNLADGNESVVPIRDVTPVMKTTDERASQSVDINKSNLNTLYNWIKRYVNQNHPGFMKLIDNDLDVYNCLEKFLIDILILANENNGNHNDIELIKEFMTNEINLKNKILNYLKLNFIGSLDGLDKLQSQMNVILSFDMDRGFKKDLKDYLHQCFLLDDNVRVVMENLVQLINNIPRRSTKETLIDKLAIYVPNAFRDKHSIDTDSRLTTSTTNTQEVLNPILFENSSQLNKIKDLEEELRIIQNAYQTDRNRFNSEMDSKNKNIENLNGKLDNLNQNLFELQKIIDGKSSEKSIIESENRKLNLTNQDLMNKFKQSQLENDRLKMELEALTMANQQLERNLIMKSTELTNLDLSMRRVSDQFVHLTSTHDSVKKSIENMKDDEIERLKKEIEQLKVFKISAGELKDLNSEQLKKINSLTSKLEFSEEQNEEMKKSLNNLKKDLEKSNAEKRELMDSIRQIREEKDRQMEEIISKLNQEPKVSLKLKSIQTDNNDDLLNALEKLKRENEEAKRQQQRDELQNNNLRNSINTLKIESKNLEIKKNSLNSDIVSLNNQIQQLRDKIADMNRYCEENHISKHLMVVENEQSELCKRKVVDLESILVCLTEELNEKVQLVEDLRRTVNTDSQLIPADPCARYCDEIDLNMQMLLQKDSEIAHLKSKICACEMTINEQNCQRTERQSFQASEIPNFLATITDLEHQIGQLNQQLTERSENIAHLQRLLNEKDEIIENSYKIIKAKSVSIDDSEKMNRLLSIQNTNIKEELSSKHSDDSQLKLLKSANSNLMTEIDHLRSVNNNLTSELDHFRSVNKNLSSEIDHLKSANNNFNSEIDNLRSENDRLRSGIMKLNSDKESRTETTKTTKVKSQIVEYSSYPPIPDTSVAQINNEIQKLYVDFEGKNNEIKEFSLREINNRDRKIDEINLELKLKSDQLSTIIIENRRLSDQIETESQISSKYEKNLLLKEQLLEKLLKEKEKIRATFISELQDKNEQLSDKNNTVYFLNAELHRLSSEVEILNAELNVVKVSDQFQVQSKNTIEINQINLDNLKTENNSLKLCINLKLAELDSTKNELTIKQISNKQLVDEVQMLSSKTNMLKLNNDKLEMDLQASVESLTNQLIEIERNYENIKYKKSIMESTIRDLEYENITLKESKERLENEKQDYRGEIKNLQSKIEGLTNNLLDCKEKISLKSIKYETEQQELQRLTNIIDINRKSINNQDQTLKEAIEQIDELSQENAKYKTDANKISNQFYALEEEYRILSGKLEKSNEDVKKKEKQLQKYQDLENELNGGLLRKSNDCDRLKIDYESVVKQCEQYRQKLQQYDNDEQSNFRLLEQKDTQYSNIQEDLEDMKKQLFVAEDRLKCCSNQWLDKYGQLKNNYELMECEFLQLQNQNDTMNQEHQLLETTINNQNIQFEILTENYHKLSEENSLLVHENCVKCSELDRLCCEKSSLENCNSELTLQNESLNRDLITAQTEICNLTVQFHENQDKLNEFSLKLRENLTSIRHYGSHPVLNQISHYPSGRTMNFEQKDYCDLQTRYSSLCGQIDNLHCQLKKKDKRLMDIQNELDELSRQMCNYNQIQCDYNDLDYKYQQLKDDFNNISHYYQNVNYSHNQQGLQMRDSEVSVGQDCSEEMQETINCQNQEINNLKSSHNMLETDYQLCCGRIKYLEEQVRKHNLEMETWHQNFYICENNFKQSENKFNQLKHVYDNLVGQIDHVNDLKQELIDKTNRIVEITNMNNNIEQQIRQAHQQIVCQNQVIEDSKLKISNLESFYEHELEQCRHEMSMLKLESSRDVEDKMNCYKERSDILECELSELQNLHHRQCFSYEQLKEDNDCQIMKIEDLRHECEEQCTNIDSLSGQLYEKSDIIEQLTAENQQINEENASYIEKINQLVEQVDSLNQGLMDKTNEMIAIKTGMKSVEETSKKERESLELSKQVGYLTGQIEQRNTLLDECKAELASNYRTIDGLKLELAEMGEELNRLMQCIADKDQCIFNKNELLTQYCKELELNYELIQKLQNERNPKSIISIQEFCEMKILNDQLTEQLNDLQQKTSSILKYGETQTPIDHLKTDLNKQDYVINSLSPISDYPINNELDRDKSHVSDLTYTSSKSVAWKSTHTDHPEAIGSGVLELQKAIDEYNTLVTSIDLSEAGINPFTDNQSVKNSQNLIKPYQDHSMLTVRNENQKVDIDLQNPDDMDIIVVDIDTMLSQSGKLDPNIPIDVQNIVSEESHLQLSNFDNIVGMNQPEFKDVIDLLKHCNVQIEYDETKEPFENYFYRMIQKYNELEQFYLASMKINIDDVQDPTNFKSMELFTELYEKSQQKLVQHCQLLKSKIPDDSLTNIDDIKLANDQKISTTDLLELVDVISSKQLQLNAIQLTHERLETIEPTVDPSSQQIAPLYVTPEYQDIWASQNVCDSNIKTDYWKVNQLPLTNKKIKQPNKFRNNSTVLSFIQNPMEKELSRRSMSSIIRNVVGNESEYSLLSETIQERNIPLENIQSKSISMKSMSGTVNLEKDNFRLSSQIASAKQSPSTMIKNDSKSINFGRTSDLNVIPESVIAQRMNQLNETRIDSSMVKKSETNKSIEPKYLQNYYEGVSIPEGKAQKINNMEDNISYASVGQFEKDMHQLNNIDFDNFKGPIEIKDRIKIYSAEIDYLNEKNLFNNYAINAVTNPDQYPLNNNFIKQLSDSLTDKAKYIHALQNEFNFDAHLSKKEKELIKNIVDPKNVLTFKKIFDEWTTDTTKTVKFDSYMELNKKFNELTKQLEDCQSKANYTEKAINEKLIESLIAEKKLLNDKLNDCLRKEQVKSKTEPTNSQIQDLKSNFEVLTKENKTLKELLQSSTEKVEVMTQQIITEKSKQSKIPLLKGSTIDSQIANIPFERKSSKWDEVNKRAITDIANVTKTLSYSIETLFPFKDTNNDTSDLVKVSNDMVSVAGKLTKLISDINPRRNDLNTADKQKIRKDDRSTSQKNRNDDKTTIKKNRSDDKSLLQSADKLVSPEDVKLAISQETSIDSLKRFAYLLAEDNFDLAAEIEKLLVTIEELRRQLKENCEILSETVDMLQNSEDFVNQLEKKLSIETKKTQVITVRIDKMNDSNGKIVQEMERILKQEPTQSSEEMSVQDRHDYLFSCLKQIEAENINLRLKKEELEITQ